MHATTICYALLSVLPHVYGDPVTLDLGPPSAFVTTTEANGPPIPTGTSLSLHKAPNGDLDLYLGDGVINQLGTTLREKCNDDGPDCESSVQNVLTSAQYDLQSRQVGVVLAVGGIVLASFVYQIIELFKSDDMKLTPVRINLPAAQLSSASASPTATEALFKTGGEDIGDLFPITAFPSGSAINTGTLTTGVVVSTATDSANGHQLGDYIFDFKDEGALKWLQDKSKSATTCAKSRKFRRDGFGCAPAAATDAMAALDGPLANLLLLGPAQLPRFVNGGDLARAVGAIFDSGRAIAALADIPDPVLWALAEMFLYFFDDALNKAAAWDTNELIPKTEFEESSKTTSAGGSCPSNEKKPACPDKDCGGDDVVATCTAAGEKSNCACAPLVTPFVNSVDAEWLIGQQKVIGSLVSAGSNPSDAKPTCMADGAPWMDPEDYCRCGKDGIYPTIPPPSDAKVTTVDCAYSTLDPSKKITPTSKEAAPTNIPGKNGVPGCAPVIYPNGQACVDANYCNCGGTPVPFLTETIDGTTTTNCKYTIQPTASSCPPPTTTPEPKKPTVPSVECNPSDGSYKKFSRDKARDAITSLCEKYHDGKLVLSKDGLGLPPRDYADLEQIEGAAEDDATLVINPVWSLNGCPDLEKPIDLDFGIMSLDDCASFFMKAVDDCPNFDNSNGDEFWKLGATLKDACGFWTVRAM
ncbi:MAG: hypothetical protein Q9164_002378 [Protoblastenia rupestris]